MTVIIKTQTLQSKIEDVYQHNILKRYERVKNFNYYKM